LLARLFPEAKNDLLQKKFNRIVSAVQKNNQVAINFYRRLEQVLKEFSDALEKGAIISVEETRHRVRLLPI